MRCGSLSSLFIQSTSATIHDTSFIVAHTQMSSKKRKAPHHAVEHAADFKKIKRKVGKKVLQKANVTNTSFATKSIHVPNQKMSSDNTVVSRDVANESSAMTNARQANLHDLCGQIKHYNVNVRKDALLGLKDLLHRHPAILNLESASLFQLILPSLLDEDRSVRGALLTLLSFMFPLLGGAGLQPFQSLLVSYVCSGLSHMHFAVKRSALQCLKLIMECEKTNLATSSNNSAAAAASSSSSAAIKSAAAAASSSSSSSILLWQSAHAQLLPNFLSCLSDRIYVSRQAHVVLAENANNKKEQQPATSSLANRAAMLQCIEQFLSLCPYVSAANSGSGSGGSGGEKNSAQSLAPSVLHSSALHSLMYPDPSVLSHSSYVNQLDSHATANIDAMDSAAMLQASSRPVPMKYARKNAQQTKFFASTLASSIASSTNETVQAKSKQPGAALTGFIGELLPLCIEYWLESFGLASGASSSSASGGNSGAAGSLTPTLSQQNKSKECTEFLVNLQSILRIIRLSLEILKGQRAEKKRQDLIESGAANMNQQGAEADAPDADSLTLPLSFPSSLRAHLFSSFPFGSDLLGSVTPHDQQLRLLNSLNAECVAVMSSFISPKSGTTATSLQQQQTQQQQNATEQNGRRKSTGARQVKQQADDEVWLEKIMQYMIESFDSLTQQSAAKSARMASSFEVPKQEATEEEEEAAMIDITVPAAAASFSLTPTTPRSSSRPSNDSLTPHSQKKDRKSFGAAAAASSSASRGLEHGSLSDLLPLLQSLLPRLSLSRQCWIVDAFFSYYLSCHPLSAPKLTCLRFMQGFLLAPARGKQWWGIDRIRATLIEEGELTSVLGVVAAATGNQIQIQAMRTEQTETTMEDSSAEASTPLLARYYEMLDMIFDLLLNAGRIYHGFVLDYNLIQPQIISLFGVVSEETAAAASSSSSSSSSSTRCVVVPGPFWTLPLTYQHKSVQLLYYFTSISRSFLSVALECLRDSTDTDQATQMQPPPLPIAAKKILLDMMEERHEAISGSLPAYIAFALGCLRNSRTEETDLLSPASISPLLPTVCRLLRGVRDDEIEQFLPLLPESSSSSPVSRVGWMLQLLLPMLQQCLHDAVEGQKAKLDLISTLIIVDELVVRAGEQLTQLPAPFVSLLSSALYLLFSLSLTGSLVEGGGIQTPHGWLSLPSTHFLSNKQSWLLGMRMLVHTQRIDQGAVMKGILKIIAQRLNTQTTQGKDSALQAIIIVLSLIKCVGVRSLIHCHESTLLPLCHTISTLSAVASQTMRAAVQSELAVIFGSKATLK